MQKKKKRNRKTLIISLAAILAAILTTVATIIYRYRDEHKVVVIFSYDQHHYGYPAFIEELENTFSSNGQHVNIDYYYLDALANDYQAELDVATAILDEASKKGVPDVILTIGDEVTYSTLHSYHPMTKEVPMVFGSVFHPNWGMLEKYPNITGLQDSTDVVKNLYIMPQLCGTHAAYTMLSNRALDRIVKKKIQHQLEGHEDIIDNTEWTHPLARVLQPINEGPYSITPFSLRNIASNTAQHEKQDSLGDNNMMFAMNAQSKLTYLQMKYDEESMNMVSVASNKPMITALWYGFGAPNSKFIGGYFASGETIAREVAEYATLILKGVPPHDIPYGIHKQDYYIDWDIAKTYGFAIDHLPEGFNVVNLTWSEKHPTLYITVIVASIVIFTGIFFTLIIIIFHERRKKKAAMRAHERSIQLYQMATSDSLAFAWERKGREFRFSDQFWQHYKQAPHPITINEMKSMLHPNSHKVFENGLSMSSNGISFTEELQADFYGQNEYHWYQIRSKAILDEDGELIQSYGIIIKIDEFKAREQELIEARKMAEDANMKEAFIANMTHEIRTPLNAIVGFASLLTSPDMEFSPEEKAEFMDAISTNNDLLLTLVNNILDLTSIESGQMEFHIEQHSVSDILEKVYKEKAQLIPKHLEFIYEKPKYDITINVDLNRIVQILSNFISNAGKFTKEGKVTLGWQYLQSSNKVEMYVEDTGIGLTDEDIEKIFTRFYKKDEFIQGTGLGLPICQVIANRLGCTIKVKSEIGKGSRFSVFFQTV